MPDDPTKNPNRISERIGKYEILGHIATGGMGVVYLARDVDLDRQVALKILPPEMAKQPVTLKRFEREAKAAAKLSHENIVRIFDVGAADGTHFIALEYIDGSDLQAYITRKCRLEPNEARNIMLQATRALIHAHEQGIVHRDIKPSNFLLLFKDNRVIVKLTDFGLAIRHENPEEFRITRDRTTVGTVDYMSPEQARDSRAADIRSDIYSLGCTFFHMLAGTAPFARGTLPERLVQHMTAPPPDMRKLNKAVPEYLVAIINRMLAKNPEDRYQTPADLLRELERSDKAAVPRKRTMAPKLERGTAIRKPGEVTSVVEHKDTDKIVEGPPQVKASKRKKQTARKGDEEDKDVDDEEDKDIDDEDKDLDDEEDTDEDSEADLDVDEDDGILSKLKKKGFKNQPLWVYGTAGSVGVLMLVLILALTLGGRTPPPKKDPERPPEPQEQEKEIVEVKPDPPPVVIDTSPSKMSVGKLPLRIMDIDPAKVDGDALRKEYAGPFAAFPVLPANVKIVKMRRLEPTGPASFGSLTEAIAQTKADPFVVIDIADNGPIFVGALPAQTQRTILLRGVDGYRPLLVWDTFNIASDAKSMATMFSLAKGKLILENLDIVMKAFDDAPAVLFELPDSDFHARNCTFALAGKSPRGLTLVRRAAGKEERRTQTRLQHCYLHGKDATLLSLAGVSADLLVEESLVVGYQQPLIQVRGGDTDAFALHCIRSTMVTGQDFLRWQSLPSLKANPRVHVRILDSILGRDNPGVPGDLLQLVDATDLSRVRWGASNSVYAGWKQLLSAGPKSIPGHDLDGWRKQWNSSDGERVVDEPWPNSQPANLEELMPAQSAVAFTALTDAGAAGCVIGRLPLVPDGWQEQAFKVRIVPNIVDPDKAPPPISTNADGLYHGERLDLNKVDLGAHLNNMLEKKPLGPRVVMHLTGKGLRETSPLRIKGVQHLVLYFESSKDAKDPFTLEVIEPSFKQRAPFIEMTDGHLEIIGARLRLGNTFVPTMIQVHQGSLTLSNSWLQGPLVRAPEHFKQLIAISNVASPPALLLLRNNVLVTSKTLIQMNEHVQLRARNNLFVSLGDGVQMEAATAPPAMVHVLEANTWAVRQSFFTLLHGKELPGGANLLHAHKNAFLHPFAEEQDKACLLRGAGPWCVSGLWSWQGRANAYDARLHAFYAGKPAGTKQALKDWQRTWGALAEQEAQTLDAAAAPKVLMLEGAPQQNVIPQLERLAVDGYGADLKGILKKKG